MEEPRSSDTPSELQKFLFLREYVTLMKRGSLLLKQEVNGLHLRWFSLNNDGTALTWVNPKKDELLVTEDNTVNIDKILSIQLGPTAQLLFEQEQKRIAAQQAGKTAEETVVDEIDPLSLSFCIIAPHVVVDISFPSRADFEVWYFGLVFLAGVNKVTVGPSVESSMVPPRPPPVVVLQGRLEEQMELNRSLLAESARLMEIRASRDAEIDALRAQVVQLQKSLDVYKRAHTPHDEEPGSASPTPGQARVHHSPGAISLESDLNLKQRQLERSSAQIRTLRQTIRTKNATIVQLSNLLQTTLALTVARENTECASPAEAPRAPSTNFDKPRTHEHPHEHAHTHAHNTQSKQTVSVPSVPTATATEAAVAEQLDALAISEGSRPTATLPSMDWILQGAAAHASDSDGPDALHHRHRDAWALVNQDAEDDETGPNPPSG